jgi:cellulose synthase/poly-beta-1,6-N-acetylglucosamine synthase-like glycosyltransferase
MSLMLWGSWQGWLSPVSDGAFGLGGFSHDIVFVLLCCALVDGLKVVIELLGRSEEREFTCDPALVSVIIPSRNGASVLPRTIEDLLRVLPASRILVVDDASDDGTSDVARAYGCTVLRFEKRKGKAAAIHFGVHRVTTPLTLLLDDDTRLANARIPTSLISEGGYDAVAFNVLPDRRNRDGARGNSFLGGVQRYEYGKSMEIGKRFHDVTESVACVSGAIGLFRTEELDRHHHEHTGVFQGEDLQRTIIHLLHHNRVVFVNEPVWTVAPASAGEWLRQRLSGWYPGLYHQLANECRLTVSRGVPWRLRYEMVYNVYTAVSDPLKLWSMFAIALTPSLRAWSAEIYLTYLAFELYPYVVVRLPGSQRRAPIAVLLFYPIYGAINTVLRTLAIPVWFWYRYVSGSMRPRTGPKDRIE